MKIYKIISIALVLELIFALYTVMPMILKTYDPSQLVLLLSILSIFILLLISAIGIFFNMKWAVITLWIYILLPFLFTMVMRIFTLAGGYYFEVLNVAAATFLSMSHWKKADLNNGTSGILN